MRIVKTIGIAALVLLGVVFCVRTLCAGSRPAG